MPEADNGRLKAALARIEARRPKPVVMDTQEKADAEGVPIGTMVMMYPPPVFVAGAQEALDDMMAEAFIRANPEQWLKMTQK